jgi:hypothetical protein
MHEQEDRSIRTELPQPLETVLVVLEVFVHLPALNVKDVDQDADLLKDDGALGGEVRVHESILSTAIPEVEDKVAQKANMVLFDVYGGSETCC